MRSQQINQVSKIVLSVLSLAALLLVFAGYTQPPLNDEGTLAHLFQLSILALVPTGFLFLVTADWTQHVRSLRSVAFPAILVVLAFMALYYLEHTFYPAQYGWHLTSRTP